MVVVCVDTLLFTFLSILIHMHPTTHRLQATMASGDCYRRLLQVINAIYIMLGLASLGYAGYLFYKSDNKADSAEEVLDFAYQVYDTEGKSGKRW